MKSVKVAVVGSINMDLTVTTDRVPEKGETVLGKEFATFPGGKGANQAVAASRLGATVQLIGAVGNDTFGTELLKHLREENIHTEGVTVVEYIATGTATIILSEKDNRIIVAPGANAFVTPELVERHIEIIQNSDVILLQLEIPLETVQYVSKIAQEFNIPVIINPAPYQDLPAEVLKSATVLTPNEVEFQEMLHSVSKETIQDKLIITKGSLGSSFYKESNELSIPAYKVAVEDTTGAGDTFNGALAVQLGGGATKEEAVRFANAAAAISVTKIGAQAGMPTREAVNNFIRNNE
ncbi:ribokinase [Ornithinibacillus californiensis]|uniref:ribokinase n=1 Tax=Ornithinibacillus californiensis TaxID=161536 RepID=UPI00064E0023